MDYLLCNFMGNHLDRKVRDGVKSVEIDSRLTEDIQLADMYSVKSNKSNIIKFVPKGSQCDGTKLDFMGNFSAERMNCSEEELKHTEENPIILVVTKGFKIFQGIPTYIKYMPVRGGVLVALIKGFISVYDNNGDLIPLSRNCDECADDLGHIYKDEEIDKMNSIIDKESSLRFSDYVVSDCIISLEKNKDGGLVRHLKFTKENFVVLNEDVFERGRAKTKQLELRREENREKHMREAAFFSENKTVKDNSKSNKKPKKKEKEVKNSNGAKEFLSYINSLR